MDKTRNILIVSLKGPTNLGMKGGAQEYIAHLARYLVNAGNRVTIVCGDQKLKGQWLPDSENIHGAELRRISYTFSKPLALLTECRRVRHEYDLVIENVMAYPLCLPLFRGQPPLIALRHHLQGKYVFRLQGPVKGLFGWVMEQIVEPLVYRRTMRVAASNVTAEMLQTRWIKPAAPVSVIPPGYDHTPVEVAKAQYPTILYVGALNTGRKKVDDLIRAFAGVHRAIPDARLVIAGSGHDEAALRRLASGLPVNFKGFVEEREKHRLMTEAWIFASPSLREGFGITWVEANGHGTPVVGYDLGLDTVNASCAVMVPKEDVHELEKALTRVLKDAQMRQQLSDGAFANAARFSWQQTGSKWEDLISSTGSESA